MYPYRDHVAWRKSPCSASPLVPLLGLGLSSSPLNRVSRYRVGLERRNGDLSVTAMSPRTGCRVNILRSILPYITKEDLGLEGDFGLCKKQDSDNRKNIPKCLRGDRLLRPLLLSGTQSPAKTPTFCPVNQLTSLFWPRERLPFLGIPALDEEGNG